MNSSPALPLTREIELSGPLAALRALDGLAHPFLLHSALEGPRARWSFFGAEPFAVHRGDADGARNRWRELAALAAAEPAPAIAPFTGGAVGYWSYDFGRRLERLPELARDDLGLPDFVLGFYDVIGAWDHVARRGWLFSSGLPLQGEARHERARQRLDDMTRLLALAGASAERGASSTAPARESAIDAISTIRPAAYRDAVRRVQDHIRRGDIFQANLSQRWRVPRPGDGLALARPLFEALAHRSPAPFAAFLDAGDHAIVSASPERFLELRGRDVETRPIKGTRPRGANPDEDQRLRAELLASAKDRAENVMIVDVLRNDLGRVCETGSIEVRGLCELETFPQVFHLTSTVGGRLARGLDAFDLLHACFPGGSITGAPKIRAMEVIESLEPVRRHLYTGTLGYLDWRGDADWNIAIRTAIVTPRSIDFAAGGAITADSDPAAEFEETLHKAEGMRAALSEIVGPLRLAGGAEEDFGKTTGPPRDAARPAAGAATPR